VRIAPNLPDSYYLLGSIYNETGELDKAINFLMLAAYVSPKDASLWKKLIPLAKKKEDASLARHCILKAMRADPEDVDLKYLCADMYRNLRDYQKAAEIYEQIVGIYPANIAVRKVAAQMYRECGQIDKAINLLEDYVNTQTTNTDWSVLDLLISLYLRNNAPSEALKQIEKARLQLRSQHKLPVQLQAKEVICHAYLGDMKHAEIFLRDVHLEPSKDSTNVTKELASNLETMGLYEYAVKFYLMIGNVANHNDGSSYIDHKELGSSYVKVAQCYMVLGDKRNAIPYFYKALQSIKDNIDIRLTLSSLLIDEDKTDEAVTLLSPPKNPGIVLTELLYATY
jgi:general transcription factor 3C polypeptide 3 (transcription factor C subunit 4)